MRINQYQKNEKINFIAIILLLNISAVSQIDTLSTEQAAVQDTVVEQSSGKKSYKRVGDFKLYGGVTTGYITNIGDNPFGLAVDNWLDGLVSELMCYFYSLRAGIIMDLLICPTARILI